MPAHDLDNNIHRWPTARARQWLTAFLGRAAYDPNVRAVVAVGSAIRSDVPSEDLDLIAICLDRSQLGERAPIEVDLRAYDLDRIEQALDDGDDLLTWSVRFGRAVFDPDGVWRDIVDRWQERLPLPDPSVGRDRAATARGQLEEMARAGDEDAMVDLNVSYLTHLARAVLAENGVYPASRPELPDQLNEIGQVDLAARLQDALNVRAERRAAHTVG